jgi:toxin ParE1/3/4
MKVHWTDTAQAHLHAIQSYIAQDSPAFAERTVDRLTRRSQQIAKFPFSGRRVPEYDIDPVREVIEGSYRLIYHIKADQVDVIAIIHAAMNLLSEPENRAEPGSPPDAGK